MCSPLQTVELDLDDGGLSIWWNCRICLLICEEVKKYFEVATVEGLQRLDHLTQVKVSQIVNYRKLKLFLYYQFCQPVVLPNSIQDLYRQVTGTWYRASSTGTRANFDPISSHLSHFTTWLIRLAISTKVFITSPYSKQAGVPWWTVVCIYIAGYRYLVICLRAVRPRYWY